MKFLSSSLVSVVASSFCITSAAGDKTLTLDHPFQTSFKKLPQKPCVSLFTREGRIGCGTSDRESMIGQVLSWTKLMNSNYYNQIAQKLPKFVAVLGEHEYNAQTVEQIIANSDSSLLQGILVVNATSSDGSSSQGYYSPAPVSPRGEDSPSAQLTPDNGYAWNTYGDGLILKDMYGIPTGFVQDSRIAEYMYNAGDQQATDFIAKLSNENVNVFDEEIKKFPPIMAEFDLYMGPEEMNSIDCLSWIDNDGNWRPKCLPLGGTSVYATAGTPYTRGDSNEEKKPIVIVGTNMDATAMFHDLSFGANSAAGNILAVLMAAKLFGESVTDDILDGLQNKIMFAFFQGENYGYIGSRSFLRDVAYPGFECSENGTVPALAKEKDKENPKMACLSPLRHDLDFMDLGNIQHMITVDQVGILTTENTFYAYDSTGNNVLTGLSSDDWTVAASSAGALPPTPLSSLVSLSGGNVGGMVLTGYDDAYATKSNYLSHKDTAASGNINLEAIAKAATIIARAALVSAYGDNYDGSAMNTIPDLDADDEDFKKAANCFFEDGNCDLLTNFAKMERGNMRVTHDADLGIGPSLGKPPQYYPSVLDSRNGQPFVQVDGKSYGAYNGDKTYGENKDDKFLVRPNLLSMSLYGLLNDYLGRGGLEASGDSNLKKCQSSSECSKVSCSSGIDPAVCTGSKVCVCPRAHYHLALDEGLVASPNNSTGVFIPSDDDDDISPMYTEPYWSNDIGVHVYRASGSSASWTLGVGFVTAAGCVAASIFLNRSLRKQKLY